MAGEKIAKIVLAVQNPRNAAIISDTLASLRGATKGRGAIRTRAEESKRMVLDRLREMVLSKEVVLADEEVRPDSFYDSETGAGVEEEEQAAA